MKNVIIFGDSYSTFAGFIPEGFAHYYAKDSRPQMGVMALEDTWWHKVIAKTGDKLIQNNSWSGSTIGYTGYGGADCSSTSSFIFRFRKLRDSGFFEKEKIDKVYVFGATNDSWSNAPLGSLKTDITESDLYSVLPAIDHFLSSVKECLPDAEIVCIINTGLKSEITDAFVTVCERLGIKKIILSDIDKIDGHPTALGMEQIAEQVVGNV